MTSTREMLSDLKRRSAFLIGVDGELGVGKTSTATIISDYLGCRCIHVDSFLNRGTGAYLPSLRYEELKKAVIDGDCPLVIEGLCLLAVLEHIGLETDHLVYIDPRREYRFEKRALVLRDELNAYLAAYSPRERAATILTLEERPVPSTSYDVDIVYLRLKTVLAVILAVGGIIQTLVGAMLLNTGLNSQGGATLKVMGAEVSATGFGAIILCTSVMWAYFAFLSRPKFSSRSESRNSKNADGSSEVYEFRSSTQVAAAPKRAGEPVKQPPPADTQDSEK